MKLEIGELRQCMALDLQERIIEILDRKKDDPNYYLLVHSRFDPLDANRVNTKILLLKEKPPMMLGTICAYVDNTVGLVKVLWYLPRDIPTFGLTDEGEPVEKVAKDAMKVAPVIYN
jgi:hypothetical protein